MTHPYSIFIWQLNRDTGGSWTEPLQAYKEYAIYVANLIHKDTKSVIKVVRYGLNITYLPDEKTVEKIEKFVARHQQPSS